LHIEHGQEQKHNNILNEAKCNKKYSTTNIMDMNNIKMKILIMLIIRNLKNFEFIVIMFKPYLHLDHCLSIRSWIVFEFDLKFGLCFSFHLRFLLWYIWILLCLIWICFEINFESCLLFDNIEFNDVWTLKLLLILMHYLMYRCKGI